MGIQKIGEWFQSKYIQRSIEKQLKKLSDSFPVIMITGSRQVGETTLLNNMREQNQINYVTWTGQELNINDITNSIEISNQTAQNWLSILVSTGLVYLLHPYSNNHVARIVKRSKMYFMDTGLACFLAGYMDSITLEKSAFNGAILETYVITEIILHLQCTF